MASRLFKPSRLIAVALVIGAGLWIVSGRWGPEAEEATPATTAPATAKEPAAPVQKVAVAAAIPEQHERQVVLSCVTQADHRSMAVAGCRSRGRPEGEPRHDRARRRCRGVALRRGTPGGAGAGQCAARPAAGRIRREQAADRPRQRTAQQSARTGSGRRHRGGGGGRGRWRTSTGPRCGRRSTAWSIRCRCSSARRCFPAARSPRSSGPTRCWRWATSANASAACSRSARKPRCASSTARRSTARSISSRSAATRRPAPTASRRGWPTPTAVVPDGVSCEMVVNMDPIEAAAIPRSALIFSDAGELGVRIADEKSQARFMPVKIVDDQLAVGVGDGHQQVGPRHRRRPGLRQGRRPGGGGVGGQGRPAARNRRRETDRRLCDQPFAADAIDSDLPAARRDHCL